MHVGYLQSGYGVKLTLPCRRKGGGPKSAACRLPRGARGRRPRADAISGLVGPERSWAPPTGLKATLSRRAAGRSTLERQELGGNRDNHACRAASTKAPLGINASNVRQMASFLGGQSDPPRESSTLILEPSKLLAEEGGVEAARELFASKIRDCSWRALLLESAPVGEPDNPIEPDEEASERAPRFFQRHPPDKTEAIARALQDAEPLSASAARGVRAGLAPARFPRLAGDLARPYRRRPPLSRRSGPPWHP